jgi:hypothetical protein
MGGTWKAIAGKRARTTARRRTGCRSGLPWRGQGVGVLAGIGCRRVPGLPPAWLVLAALDHRQFGRAFVLSIGKASHEATTAPVMSGAWKAIAGKRARTNGETAHRLPIGRAVAWSVSRGAGRHRLQTCARAAAGVACAGGARSSAVRPGFRPLDRESQPRGDDGASVGRCLEGDRRQAGQDDGETAPPAADWACRGLVSISGCGQASVAGVPGCRRRGLCWQRSITGSSAGPSSSRSGKPATRRRRRQWSSGAGWRSPASGPGRRRDGAPAADRGCRGLVRCRAAGKPRLPPAWSCWRRSITGSSAGPSSSRSVKAGHEATTAPVIERCLGGDRRQAGQAKARRRTGCRSGLPWPGQVSGCWQSAGCRRRGPCWRRSIIGSSAGLRPLDRESQPRGDDGASVERCLVAIAGKRARTKARQRTGCRSGLPWRGQGVGLLAMPRLPPAWLVLAALDHRQFGRAFVLSIGKASHEATTAPVSGGTWWRSPASGPGRRRDGAPAADRACRGLVSISGCGQASVADAPGLPPAWPVLAALDHRQFGRAFVLSIGKASHGATTAPVSSGTWWRSPASGPGRRRGGDTGIGGCLAADRAAWSRCRVLASRGCRRRVLCWRCSITGSSAGPSSSRSVKASHEATTAPVSGGTWKAIAGKRARTKARRHTGCRSGVPWPGQYLGVRAGIGCRRVPGLPPAWPRAGGARSSAVRPGFRPLDRESQPRGDDGASDERCLEGDRRQAGQDDGETAHRLPIGRCRGWSVVSGLPAGIGCRRVPGLPPAWPVLAALDHRQFGRAFVLSIGKASHEATTAPVIGRCLEGDRRQAGQDDGETAHRLPIGRAVAWSVSRGAGRHRLQTCARVAAGVVSAGGLDHRQFGRALRPLDRESQPRGDDGASVGRCLEGDRRQAGQDDGETAHRLPIGRAVAWSVCRGAGRHRLQTCARAAAGVACAGGARSSAVRPGFRPLDRESQPRGDDGASDRAVPGRRSPASGPGRRRDGEPAADRACRGLVSISGCGQASVADVCQGCRRRGLCWQCSIIGSSAGLFVLSIGKASHEATTAPAIERYLEGDRRQAGQARRRDGAPAADWACRGLVSISGCGQASVADVGCRRRGLCWQCSITGSSAGLSSSRSGKPATRRRRRQ